MSSFSRAVLPTLAVVLVACGTRFVEPNPPELRRVRHSLTSPIIDEPVAWLLLVDLHITNPADCAAAQARIDAQLRETLLANGRHGVPIATIEIAPTCTQSPWRWLDVNAVEELLVDARDRLSPRLRPLIVYVNNVDLALSPDLSSALASIPERFVARGGLRPVLIGIAHAKARETVPFDVPLDWTFSGDAALTSSLLTLANAELPHRTQLWSGVQPQVLLEPDVVPTVSELKVCSPDGPLEPTGFTLDGMARPIDLQTPPRYRVLLTDSLAVPPSSFVAESIDLELELCSGNCDRFVRTDEGALAEWNAVPGCFSTEPAAEVAE